jgi:hypothetical protein
MKAPLLIIMSVVVLVVGSGPTGRSGSEHSVSRRWLALAFGIIAGLIGWMNQSYLQERWRRRMPFET